VAVVVAATFGAIVIASAAIARRHPTAAAALLKVDAALSPAPPRSGESRISQPTRRSPPAALVRPFGIRLELWAFLWFLITLSLAWAAHADSARRSRFSVHLFLLASVGVGVVVRLVSYFAPRITQLGVERLISTLCVATIFALSVALPHARLGDLAANGLRDIGRLMTHKAPWLGVLAFACLAMAERPRGSMTTEEFEAWYSSQPRSDNPALQTAAPVTVVKFLDYQCPACRVAEEHYGPVLTKLMASYPSEISVQTRDLPLDAKCNPSAPPLHSLACDAAVIVRLAEEQGNGAAMRAWLWSHQSGLTQSQMRQAAHEVGGIESLDRNYARGAADVAVDVQLSHDLGLRGTPTYFVNGVALQFVPKKDFEIALVHELQAAASTAKRQRGHE